MPQLFRWAVMVFCVCWACPAHGQDSKSDKKTDGKEKAEAEKVKDPLAFTLENLFDEKSYFGPSASDTQFSADGRYAAFLYRPYLERRHGGDLHIHDFDKGTTTRVTSVAKMAEFQEATRKVKEDRVKKLKKKAEEAQDKDKKANVGSTSDGDDKKKQQDTQKTAKAKKDSAESEIDESGNTVTEEDGEDEKAPRYGGVSAYAWHPEKNQLLFMSAGDIYQLDVAQDAISRLTKTDAAESQFAYLPDGSGFVYGANDVIYRVRFDDSFIEQLNPSLPAGQNLSGFELSPDGKKIVIVSRTGSRGASGRTVDIIRYRDRFAKGDSVPRTVSDDTVPPSDTFVYLYDLEKSRTEESRLIQIFQNTVDEPRDTISSPKWSLDSSRITFCFFDQETSEVQLRLGEFPEDVEKLKVEPEAAKAEGSDAEGDGSEQSGRFGRRERTSPAGVIKHDSKIVYQFRHFGGPNTPGMVAPQFAWDNRHIVFISEISGYRHVHLIDVVYESVSQLTTGNYEVYPFQISKDQKTLFVRATKDHPSREMVYQLNLENGELVQLGDQVGNYSAVAVSDDGKRMLANFVRYGELSELFAVSEKKKMTALTSSHTEKAEKFTEAMPEMFDYENRHGHAIHAMMFKPEGWKKGKKYPLLIYVYGGPLGSRHSVVDGSYSSDGYFFNNYMSQHHGYLTVVIDPRGQSGYGGVFEKANYEQVGKPQVEDLVDGVNYLKENFGADPEKVGIYGWSFGGFQTQMCLYTEPKVFQVGIAGAGPTEWENYNSWYTTGTVGPSQKGQPDQKKYSLRPLAKNLEGKLLLIHGMEDTNVLFQDSVAIYRELLKAGKETNVELFLDPTGGHGLGGDVKRLNRYRKYEEFLLRTLGTAKTK